jgi:hypothetical protein
VVLDTITPVHEMSAAFEFMKGYTWGYPGVRGEYSHQAAADSMRKRRDTGTQWIGLAFSAIMSPVPLPRLDNSLMRVLQERTAIQLLIQRIQPYAAFIRVHRRSSPFHSACCLPCNRKTAGLMSDLFTPSSSDYVRS